MDLSKIADRYGEWISKSLFSKFGHIRYDGYVPLINGKTRSVGNTMQFTDMLTHGTFCAGSYYQAKWRLASDRIKFLANINNVTINYDGNHLTATFEKKVIWRVKCHSEKKAYQFFLLVQTNKR